MKTPESLFKIINLVVKLLLHSPLHFIMSSSVMIITFKGRKSGNFYSTPVRYLETNNDIRFFTSNHGKWWKNLKGGAGVRLLIKGHNQDYHAEILDRGSPEIRSTLIEFLSYFPQDAAYHEIKLKKDKSLIEADLNNALPNVIAIKAKKVPN